MAECIKKIPGTEKITKSVANKIFEEVCFWT